jgi:hypothetical protein
MTRQMVGPLATIHMPSSSRAIIMRALALKSLCVRQTRQVGGACHVLPMLGRSSLFSLFLTYRCGEPLHYKREVPRSKKG